MSDNFILNKTGEIIGVADVVGADTPANAPVTIPPNPILGGTVTTPSNTPSGQNGAAVLQIGNCQTGEIYSSNTEFWSGCPGIVSLPTLPTSTTSTDACQVMYYNKNSQNIGFAYRDTRFLYNAGNIQPGETIMFSSPVTGPSAKVKCGNDGSVTLATKSSNGDNVYMELNPNGWYFHAPFGSFAFDANGFMITTASGAMFHMGGFASGILPGPLAGLTSFVNINAGMCNVSCPAVSLGTGPVFAQAVVPVSPVYPPFTPLPMFTTMAAPGVCVSLT